MKASFENSKIKPARSKIGVNFIKKKIQLKISSANTIAAIFKYLDNTIEKAYSILSLRFSLSNIKLFFLNDSGNVKARCLLRAPAAQHKHAADCHSRFVSLYLGEHSSSTQHQPSLMLCQSADDLVSKYEKIIWMAK